MVEGDSLGRTKINAVPFALEAKTAVAVGKYDEAAIQAVEDDLGARPVFTRYELGLTFSQANGHYTFRFRDEAGEYHGLNVAFGADDAGSDADRMCFVAGDPGNSTLYVDLGEDPGSCSAFVGWSSSPGSPAPPLVGGFEMGRGTAGTSATCFSESKQALRFQTPGQKAALVIPAFTKLEIVCVK